MNRYKVAREISERLVKLSNETGCFNDSFEVRFTTEKHLADRVIDRKVDMTLLLLMFDKIIKNNLCQLLFYVERTLNERDSPNSERIHFKYRDYMLSCTGKRIEKGYAIKFRTILWHPSGNIKNIIDLEK